jgi:hypothetical protein
MTHADGNVGKGSLVGCSHARVAYLILPNSEEKWYGRHTDYIRAREFSSFTDLPIILGSSKSNLTYNIYCIIDTLLWPIIRTPINIVSLLLE